jgi:hypothetical protein
MLRGASLIGSLSFITDINDYITVTTNNNSMLPPDPIFHKPKSIIAAKNILYATVFLGIINWVIGKLTTDLTGYSNSEGIIVTFLTLIVIFLLTKQIGYGKKWARTVFLILFILGIIIFPFAVVPLFKLNLLLGVLCVFQALLQILALKFLFTRESTHWFNTIREALQEPSK